MKTRIAREAILREMVSTLVRGWGRDAVYKALDDLSGFESAIENKENREQPQAEQKAVILVEKLPISGVRRELLLKLARDFDDGTAFQKMSDIRSFLMSHHCSVRDIKSRHQAFSRILPLLIDMSEKGLMKVISRSQYSGPAELGSISDAIKGAGENLRRGKSEGDPDSN